MALHPQYPIRTERLELRPYRMDDLDDLFAIESDPEVVRYLPMPLRDREQTRTALEVKVTRDALTEPGQLLMLAMELRETGTVIGEVALQWTSEMSSQGELSYAMHTGYHGHGLATEAARAVLRLGFEDLGLHRVSATVIGGNTASTNLLTRLGMRQEAHLVENIFFKGEWRDDLIYAIRETDFSY